MTTSDPYLGVSAKQIAGFAIAAIIAIAVLAAACSSGRSSSSDTPSFAPSTSENDQRKTEPIECADGLTPVYHPDGWGKCLPPRECKEYESPLDFSPSFALYEGFLNACKRASASEMGVHCSSNEHEHWNTKTNTWGCKPKTQGELIADRCEGEPRSASNMRSLNSGGTLGSRCLILVCEMPKNDTVGDRYWSNYSCTSSWWSGSVWAERHRLLSSSEAEAMEFQSGSQTISDLNKRFSNCIAKGYTKTNLITEYDGVGFWCDIG